MPQDPSFAVPELPQNALFLSPTAGALSPLTLCPPMPQDPSFAVPELPQNALMFLAAQLVLYLRWLSAQRCFKTLALQFQSFLKMLCF